MTHTVIGIFDSKEEARNAMNALVQNGFIQEDIDVSTRKKVSETDAGTAATDSSSGVGDSISNFFNNLFGDDDYMNQNYSNVARETEGIVAVQTDSRDKASKAAEILDNNGAIDVDERAAQYQKNTAQSSAATQNRAGGEMAIPVIEENLNVGKRAVESGGVRVKSRIVEKPVEETVRLRQEHVVVDRRPVDRAATATDFNNFKEGDFEITERAEKAVVGKEARVVGEVAVGKTVEEREKTISDTVKRTEVDVDEINSDIDARRATDKT
ncbi:hypothetical protein BH24ACI2_BH24ACI2_04850 [soil metagenome]|jgi:uncharacterized protein (TIGR02271 family)